MATRASSWSAASCSNIASKPSIRWRRRTGRGSSRHTTIFSRKNARPRWPTLRHWLATLARARRQQRKERLRLPRKPRSSKHTQAKWARPPPVPRVQYRGCRHWSRGATCRCTSTAAFWANQSESWLPDLGIGLQLRPVRASGYSRSANQPLESGPAQSAGNRWAAGAGDLLPLEFNLVSIGSARRWIRIGRELKT